MTTDIVRARRFASRAAALAILLLAVLAFWSWLVDPLLAGQGENMARQERFLRFIVASRRGATARPALETQLADLRRREASLSGLVAGATAPLAAAALQGEVKRLIEANGGEIRSVQNLAPVAADGFEAIEMVYDLTIPLRSLQSLLAQIDGHQLYLFLDHVDVRAPEGARPEATGTEDTRLAIRWNLRAYRRADKP